MHLSTWPRKALTLAHMWWPRALACAWFPLLYLITLTPTPTWRRPGPEPFMFCLLCGDRGGADLVLNVAMFVPLGLLAARRFGLARTVVLGFSLSLGIELVQLNLPGRFSTFADILANTGGAALGATIYGVGSTLARGSLFPRSAGVAAAIFSGSLVFLGGWLVEPSPTKAVYWGQWTPSFGPGTRYPGEVLAAELNGRPFPSWRFPEALNDPSLFLADWRLEGKVRKGEALLGVTSVLSVFDTNQDEILYVGAFREHLLLRERLRAQDWGLDRPELVAWDLLDAIQVGDTMRVVVQRTGSERCLSVDDRAVCGVGFTPSSLWGLLLYPASAPRWMRAVAGLGVMVLLFFPTGFLARSWREVTSYGAVTAALMAAAIAVTRLGFEPLFEVSGAVAGLVAGYAAATGLRWAGDRLLTGPESDVSATSAPGYPGSGRS
ncbi:MAG: VanZ family protein [Actinomycetota bacterium]